jgi:type I restriction enzyme R subunit
VRGVEQSLSEQRYSRSLVQLATGAGKTFTAVTESYRLLKHGGFRRILFLVDRNDLGDQTLREFRDYTTPDDGRKSTELYNVDKLTVAGMVGSSAVVISRSSGSSRSSSGQEVPDADDPNVDAYVPDKPHASAVRRPHRRSGTTCGSLWSGRNARTTSTWSSSPCRQA